MTNTTTAALGCLLFTTAFVACSSNTPQEDRALGEKESALEQHHTTEMPSKVLAESTHSYVLACDDARGECFDMAWCGKDNIRMHPVEITESNPNWMGISAAVCANYGTPKQDIACVCCKPDSCMNAELGCVPCGQGQLCDDMTNQCYCSGAGQVLCNGACVSVDDWTPACGGRDPCELRCNGRCVVDPQTDPNDCGTCGNACQGGTTCVAGKCECPDGFADCGSGQCDTDLRNDDASCGACGHACPAGASCNGSGYCKCDRPGERLCGGQCVDTTTDANNCGRCGTTCAGGDICNASVCCGNGSSTPCK